MTILFGKKYCLLAILFCGASIGADQKKDEFHSCFDVLRAALLVRAEQSSSANGNEVLFIEEIERLCLKCLRQERYCEAINQALEEKNAEVMLNDAQDAKKNIKRSAGHAAYPKGCEPDRDCNFKEKFNEII